MIPRQRENLSAITSSHRKPHKTILSLNVVSQSQSKKFYKAITALSSPTDRQAQERVTPCMEEIKGKSVESQGESPNFYSKEYQNTKINLTSQSSSVFYKFTVKRYMIFSTPPP